MKIEFHPIEKMNLLGLLESYKQITIMYRDMGWFKSSSDDEYNPDMTIKALDYFINKINQEGTEIEMEELAGDMDVE